MLAIVAGAISRRRSLVLGSAVLSAAIFCASCMEPYPTAINRGRLAQGNESRSSVSFAMNGRMVKLELLIKVGGTGATIEIDHPDGRTTEAIEIDGPGIRQLCREMPKEPGSWGLRVVARQEDAVFWVALHDRKKYIGPDEDARRYVERE